MVSNNDSSNTEKKVVGGVIATIAGNKCDPKSMRNSGLSPVSRPKIMICLKDLSVVPCPEYCDVIVERYGDDGKFDPLDLIDELSSRGITDVRWVITNCEYCQTEEMVVYYKTLNPNAGDVSMLMIDCEYCQTPEMVAYFRDCNPSAKDACGLIAGCRLCQTSEMLEYFKSLNPSTADAADVNWLISKCHLCQTEEMVVYFKSRNPDATDVNWLIVNCRFCQTSQMLEYYKSLNPDADDVGWLIRAVPFFPKKDVSRQ